MSNDKDKPTLVNFELPPDELGAAIEQYKRQLPFLIEHQIQQAKIIRAKYCACIEEGFTEVQALELCNKI